MQDPFTSLRSPGPGPSINPRGLAGDEAPAAVEPDLNPVHKLITGII